MSPSILIVEDEPIVQFQYKLYLDERGYNCNCVSSLKEAKEIIFEGKHFDLVLLDNHLDDGDGIGKFKRPIHSLGLDLVHQLVVQINGKLFLSHEEGMHFTIQFKKA